MKLRYTPEARRDLRLIKQYIAVDLCNPIAAESVIQKILKSCAVLKEHSNMGVELSEKIQRDTDLRYIISGKHLVFYRVENDYISIVRILDSRTNYIRAVHLF